VRYLIEYFCETDVVIRKFERKRCVIGHHTKELTERQPDLTLPSFGMEVSILPTEYPTQFFHTLIACEVGRIEHHQIKC
jgi:hypothetical protein